MKIFVITFDDVDDFATLHHDIEAFSKYEDAKKRFDDIVYDAKQLFLENEWEETDSADFYETWPDGYWGTNHYAVYLNTVELK